MEFDEQAAIAYIRAHIPAEIADKYDDDEILNVIDIIWEYYDENGMLEIDLDEDDDEDGDGLNMDKLVGYVKKMIAKDRKCPIVDDDVESIVKAEIDYEDTLF